MLSPSTAYSSHRYLVAIDAATKTIFLYHFFALPFGVFYKQGYLVQFNHCYYPILLFGIRERAILSGSITSIFLPLEGNYTFFHKPALPLLPFKLTSSNTITILNRNSRSSWVGCLVLVTDVVNSKLNPLCQSSHFHSEHLCSYDYTL